MWLKQFLLDDEVPKENVHYACIACITIDSVIKMEKKKNYPQIYLEECKYNTELKSELESHTELKWKPELESDSE